MKRFGLFAVVAVVLAVGISFALRKTGPISSAAVTELLPRDTVAMLHVPDFNRMRDQWHGTDIYKLYREPAVQEFLDKPLHQTKKADSAAQIVREIEQLGIRDGFVALISVENNHHILVAGFRFRGSQASAEKVIDKWRAETARDRAEQQSVEYQQHKIEVTGEGLNLSATTYDKDWFFAANDLDQLKLLLDRADHRQSAETLQQDENFRAATAHMPSSYAAMFYLQPKKFAAIRNQAASPGQQTLFDQMQSVCGAMRIEGGKIHDVWFVGMPNQNENASLKRSAAALGTADTFLYLATLVNPDRAKVLGNIGNATAAARWFQKFFDATARAGITAADWRAAFDLELGSLADWPADAHWPAVVATLPVKDPARAKKIVNALPAAIDEDGGWTKIQKDGVQYYVMQSPVSWFAVAPTIALSNKLLAVGIDSRSVEETIKRVDQAGAGLAQLPGYKSAIRALPEPTNSFVYVDLPLLYNRLDASLRPMLMMAAMFMPAISGNVDLNKLPTPEIVTRHLSPVVSSQRYERDGYVTESIGPVTITQLAVTVAIPAVFWFHGHHSGW
jgi:hypothetical protein